MLTLTHRYRIYPNATQEHQFIEWMEICRVAYNYALREIKDWCDSRKVKYVCWKRGKFFAEVDARGTSQECPECNGEVKKHLNVRVHDCPHCGYRTDRDVAAGQNIRNRGIKLISTFGQKGIESACADDLPRARATQSRQVSKSRKGTTRKPKK